MKKFFARFGLALMVNVFCFGSPFVPTVSAGQDPDDQNPLVPFARLIGGQWHLEGSYHEFEWGVGKTFVRARSYFIVNDQPKMVSEAIWFWHPGAKAIHGYSFAIDMPVVFFDYRSRFEGAKMISDLTAYSPDGTPTKYQEIWQFIDKDTYEWSLLAETPDGLKKAMGGTYQRR